MIYIWLVIYDNIIQKMKMNFYQNLILMLLIMIIWKIKFLIYYSNYNNNRYKYLYHFHLIVLIISIFKVENLNLYNNNGLIKKY